jgi:hypothetical protein
MNPKFVRVLDAIAGTDTTGAERALLLAAARWISDCGEIWKALEQWASLAGLTTRGAQRILRRLEERGIVRMLHRSKGGLGDTSKYLLVCCAPENPDPRSGFQEDAGLPNPDRPSGLEPRPGGSPTPTARAANPDRECSKPRPTVAQSSRQSEEQSSTASRTGAVVDQLSPELLKHPNATRERLDWISREAPSKDNPTGWGAKCIREGWEVPPPSPRDAAVNKRERRERLLFAFNTWGPEERAAVIGAARARFPNMINLADADPTFRLAGIGTILDEMEKQD